jgi:uncharacterized LabA/DUF88 family protein
MCAVETRKFERVAVYIDGYNLYFGLCDSKWRKYLWLDLPALASSLLKPGQRLVAVKYFTARVGKPEGSVRRQGKYLDALTARGGLKIIEGNFIYNPEECDDCHRVWLRREEKQTDVGIAVHMLCDAEDDCYDVAILISGDSDQIPAVSEITRRHPGRKVVVASPPMRVSKDLNSKAHAWFVMGEQLFADAQLPDCVQGKDGYALYRPVEWWDDPSAPADSN